MADETPKRLTGIPAFMPAKDTGAYWRNKMASQEEDDVVIYWDKDKSCFQTAKKT